MSNVHRVMPGVEVCIHTCNPGGCQTRQKSRMWKIEGGACMRHAVNPKMHPDCSGICPGNGATIDHHLGRQFKTRAPTDEDWALENAGNNAGMAFNIPHPHPHPAPPSTSTSAGETASTGVDVRSTDLTIPRVIRPALAPALPPAPKFKASLLMIPDPTRRCRKALAIADASFVEAWLPDVQYAKVKHLTEHVHRLAHGKGAQKGHVKCLLYDWVWVTVMMESMPEPMWSVSYMQWEDFRAMMLRPNDHLNAVQEVIKYDIVMGGLDFTLNYINNQYDLTATEVKTYSDTLSILSQAVCFWPSVTAVRQLADKRVLAGNLDAVVATETHTPRPRTDVLDLGAPIPKNTVLKRTASDTSCHVVFPASVVPQDGPCRTRAWLEENSIDGCTWLSQEYVQTLRELGEWRTYMVEGRPVGVIHTVKSERDPDKLEVMVVREWCSLAEISARYAAGESAGSVGAILHPSRGDVGTRDAARSEFYDFVLKTHAGLRKREFNQTLSNGSLGVLCRMDIGIYLDSDGRAHYFVNEVERTHTMGLFGQIAGHELGILADSFGHTLHKLVQSHRDGRL
ncbi:hypothetical protein BJ138DRAFT_1120692 [Hygrophoropsis aurantiaca]|uniref:Uncharacterized protein n=1 Tax=Hygrophoropsis aurantiaca TaxID=72124 RepID=A0ACB7ZPJ2_9AGAM|nr:hypothetical protein BJ138DRAFT_1120692 [Hygrophoropsis aurantiaca]